MFKLLSKNVTKIIIILFLLLFVMALSASAQDKKIKIMLFEWPPYVGTEMTNNGFTADILITAFQNAGYEVKYQYFPWRRCISNLDKGLWDVLINVYYTDKRAATYAYPQNHISTSVYTLYALKNRTDIPDTVTLENLNKLKVGLINKASYGAKFDAIKVSLPNTYTGALGEKNLLPMLLKNRVDIVPSDIQAGWFILKNKTDKWNLVRTINSEFFEKKKLFPVFTKKNPNYMQFISDWDKSIEKMINDGSLVEIHKKHGATYSR